MSEITRTSFYYDPIRQGYDTNSWRTISGAPAVAGSGRIVVDAGTGIPGSAIHYADFLKGDISFNINIPSAPAAGDTRYFGVSAPNTSAYIRFAVGASMTFQTSDGATATESSALTWDSALTGANAEYRIRWEAGTAKFYINGSLQYAVSDASVPSGPLSLYLYDNSNTAMTIGDINVRGTQSYAMHLATSDSSPTSGTGTVSVSQSVTVTENYTVLIPTVMIPFVSGGMSDSVTVTENILLSLSLPGGGMINEVITVTESVSLYIDKWLPSVNDTVTVSEDVSMFLEVYTLLPSKTETVTVTDLVSAINIT